MDITEIESQLRLYRSLFEVIDHILKGETPEDYEFIFEILIRIITMKKELDYFRDKYEK